MPWDIDADISSASEEWLKEYIALMEASHGTLAGLGYSNQVIKLSDKVVVKRGFGVRAQEAAIQDLAHRHVDPAIVRVPRVYRFFEEMTPRWSSPRGYLFMEYLDGWTLDDLDLGVHADIVPRVANIIAHLGRISHPVPGPLGGGKARGYIWSDEGARAVFHSPDDLNAWVNKRLALHRKMGKHDKTIDVSSEEMVLCHMDLVRRNMIMLPDRTICLVDFGHAGLFPRFFEAVSLNYLNPYDGEYTRPLREALPKALGLTEREEMVNLMHRITAVQLRFPYAL
jgi:Ser/Thr protein kinase RdoA (MazF antagonist)